MLIKEDFLKKLRAAFDLNIYEVKIWTAMLSRGVATAGELSDMSNVPRSRSYDVLESLEKKGFVIMKLGKPIKYIAVKPEEILRRLKDGIQRDALERVKYLEGVQGDDIFSELDLLYRQGIKKIDPTGLAGAIRGRDNVYTHLRGMLERAEKNVTIATTSNGLFRKVKRFKTLFGKLNERGVKIRVVAPSVEQFKELADVKNSIQLRTGEGFKGRFVILDDKEVLIMVTDDKDVHEDFDTAVWVSTPYFVKAFGEMFTTAWNTMKINGNGGK